MDGYFFFTGFWRLDRFTRDFDLEEGEEDFGVVAGGYCKVMGFYF